MIFDFVIEVRPVGGMLVVGDKINVLSNTYLGQVFLSHDKMTLGHSSVHQFPLQIIHPVITNSINNSTKFLLLAKRT